VAAAAIALLSVLGTACGHAARKPRSTAATLDRVEEALAPGTSDACREQVRAELLQGRRQDEGCSAARAEATKRTVRTELRRPAFGVVESRRIDLTGVHLVVSSGLRCKRWPLRSPRSTVLELPDARAARCSIRRYEGTIGVSAVAPDGTRWLDVFEIESDVDGRVTLQFAALDAALRSRGMPSLDAFARLELGTRGWAGVLDLGRMRDFIADWHFEWVRRGRGAPGLFVARHPWHERAGAARALAVEGILARQERDYLAVARGELLPREFLSRYAWSPYRRSVKAMAAGRSAVEKPSAGLAGSP
jgi:hypothetical protein